ncbi:chondroitinase-B domain-containing protein [Paenibacillus cymbidii]|uniref:chondroitinase-B domain-containing protein n=1 Tax=Paenibacillus cymbidii TaxID=1639034 RepID=UPI001436B614|nr:chondroitinase-B domain-containing protein [Paenibacillus cymbidii]
MKDDGKNNECDGEGQIISGKTSNVTLRNNTFWNSVGSLTLRHGNNNEVYGNTFMGDGVKADVGGTVTVQELPNVTNKELAVC